MVFPGEIAVVQRGLKWKVCAEAVLNHGHDPYRSWCR